MTKYRPINTAPYRTPEPALDTAQALTTDGHHVHYVSEGQTRCLSGHCTPRR